MYVIEYNVNTHFSMEAYSFSMEAYNPLLLEKRNLVMRV